MRPTLISEAVAKARARSSTRSRAYASSRFVKAQSPSAAARTTPGRWASSSASLIGPASRAASAAAAVVAMNSVPVAVRASWRRRSGSASSKWKRTSASPSPSRSTIETRMIVVSSSSAVP